LGVPASPLSTISTVPPYCQQFITTPTSPLIPDVYFTINDSPITNTFSLAYSLSSTCTGYKLIFGATLEGSGSLPAFISFDFTLNEFTVFTTDEADVGTYFFHIQGYSYREAYFDISFRVIIQGSPINMTPNPHAP